MWDLRIASPVGRISIRNLLLWAAATLAASLTFILFIAPAAHAADATWAGSSLSYNGNTYMGPVSLPDGNSTGIPKDAKIYSFSEPATNNQPQKVHLIYFDPGTDTTKATSAKYVEYLFTPPNTYASPSNQKTISIDETTASTSKPTSCAVQNIGWLVCGVSNFLADGMDWIFDILKTFVEVKPLGLDQNNDLYTAWNVMRGFANVAFIIGFLVVIYSQVTNIGISNYGIKKILPRLVVAAILVNVSYYVCAIAVDLSNIVGMGLQGLLIGIREQTFHISADTVSQALNWKNLTAFILSGGTAAAIGIPVALTATGGTIMGAVFALLPILLGLFLIILVVLIILAARQALIIILVIISPLAFVARLLPGTEKWSHKWNETFTTMLVFFPGFSLIFGGSQLAGGVIIQNATTIVMILFGMAVQIAPLALVPLILKLSTGLLGRIAGMVNNPKKGLVDRAKNWSKGQQEMHKQRGIGSDLRRRNVFRRAARGLALNEQKTARNTERYKQGFEAYAAKRTATNKARQKIELELEIAKVNAENWQAQTKRAINEFKAGDTQAFHKLRMSDPTVSDSLYGTAMNRFRKPSSTGPTAGYTKFAADAMKRAVQADQQARVISQANHMAEHEQQQNFASALRASQALQNEAGGISAHGADAALAAAIATERKAYGESVAEARQIVKHFNLSSEQRQAHALGKTVTVKDSHGNSRTFDAHSIFTREAVIEDQVSTGTVAQANEIVALSGSSLAEFRTTISDAVAKAGLGAKTIYLGGATINEIAKGTINSPEKLVGVAQDNIAKGKISADKLVTIDKDAVEFILNAAKQTDTSKMDPGLVAKLQPAIQDLKKAADLALTDDILKAKVTDNVRPLLQDMLKLP